jgi:hypothetical protein
MLAGDQHFFEAGVCIANRRLRGSDASQREQARHDSWPASNEDSLQEMAM